MSAVLASDANNPAFIGAHNPDQVLHVQFYGKAVEQPFKSSLAGRPIYEDMVYIQITTPGIPMLNQIDRPMREADKHRFPRHWDYFERTQGKSGAIGTPVEQWPFLTRAAAEELRAARFFTVESIAAASDQQISTLGMLAGTAPHVIRDRAKAYLSSAESSADKEHLASELAKRDAEIEDMRKQIAAMMAQQSALLAAAPPMRETLGKPNKAPA